MVLLAALEPEICRLAGGTRSGPGGQKVPLEVLGGPAIGSYTPARQYFSRSWPGSRVTQTQPTFRRKRLFTAKPCLGMRFSPLHKASDSKLWHNLLPARALEEQFETVRRVANSASKDAVNTAVAVFL